jgi:hypothetical protein
MNTPATITSTDPTGGVSSKLESLAVTEDSSIHVGHSNLQNQDTTVFVDDANVVQRDESHVVHIDRTLMRMQDTNNDEQSIKSFLLRPIIIKQASFNITDTYSFLDSTSMPFTALNSANAVMWREKLRGIYGIRMDMRFRLVVNANRFQQGRYIMGWMPTAGMTRTLSALKEVALNNSHMATLVQRTTVPHVEVDLATDTVAELLVPFVSCKNFYNLNAVLSALNDYPLGYLNIYPYSPLVSPAGSTTAGYTLYVSFENVQLFGASSPQSGLARHKRISDLEVSQKQLGPISSISESISRGFKEFANIPLLSTYANSISWVADRVTNVASVFGWSKPLAGDSMAKMLVLQAPNHNTVDGDSDARPLSYLSKPGVVALHGSSGTDFDEMDFAYIVRKPAWFQTMTWPTSTPAGIALTNGSITVSPYTQTTVSGCFNYQPVAFVASFFQFWRGSLRYRFKVVKTEFHSGRLSVAFYPGNTVATLTALEPYVQRQIVDIRDAVEFEFVVPYISDTPWSFGRTGILNFTVVDPLVAPATVSSSITILCEISGGEDFEVAIPAPPINITPSSFVPQSGLSKESSLITMNIGDSTVIADPNVSTALAIGDKISNFRAFLKRYTPLRYLDNTSATGVKWNLDTVQIYTDFILAVSPTPPANFVRADHVSIVASCYAIIRGGFRIRDVVNKNLLQGTSANAYGPSMATVWSRTDPATTFSVGNVIANFAGSGAVEPTTSAHLTFQDLALNGVITVEQPQYSSTFARSVGDLITNQGSAASLGYSAGLLTSTTNQLINISLPIKTTISVPDIAGQQVHNLYRSLADDADFGLFISVPPMRTSVTSSVSNPGLY